MSPNMSPNGKTDGGFRFYPVLKNLLTNYQDTYEISLARVKDMDCVSLSYRFGVKTFGGTNDVTLISKDGVVTFNGQTVGVLTEKFQTFRIVVDLEFCRDGKWRLRHFKLQITRMQALIKRLHTQKKNRSVSRTVLFVYFYLHIFNFYRAITAYRNRCAVLNAIQEVAAQAVNNGHTAILTENAYQ